MASTPFSEEAVKRRLAELIVRNLRLPPSKADAIFDAFQLDVDREGGMFMSWSLTGHGHSLSADEIDEVAQMFADEYRAERVEIPSFTGVDPEKNWREYVEEAGESR